MDYEKLRKKRIDDNQFAKYVGIDLIEISFGYAKAELLVDTAKHINPQNSVHGGCIYTLADVAAGAAASSYGYYSVTVSSDIHYLLAVLEPTRLLAEAHVIKHGKTLSVFEVVIYAQPDKILTKGTFTYYHSKVEIEI